MYNYVDYLDDVDMPVVTDDDDDREFRRIRSAQLRAAAFRGNEDDED